MDRAREIARKWLEANEMGYGIDLDFQKHCIPVACALIQLAAENAKLKAVVDASRRISLSHNYVTASERIEQLNHALRELDAGVGDE